MNNEKINSKIKLSNNAHVFILKINSKIKLSNNAHVFILIFAVLKF